MLRSENRTIGGKTWTVTTMGADDGMEVAAELSAVILPVLGKASAALGSTFDIRDMDLSALGDAAAELAARIREPAVRKIIKKLCTTGVHCDGVEIKDTPQSFGLTFAGEYDLMLQVAAFAVEVNFKIPFGSWLSAARVNLERERMRQSTLQAS